jgi:dephospho-CoA kinase
MLRVALTGGIATGKSYVRARVDARGVPTIDADEVVHHLLEAGTPVSAAIAERFGASVLRPDGAVDRGALGRLVFADAAARADLERLVHPRVFEAIATWMDDRRRAGAPWVLADIPLLFETGRQAGFDRVIVAACAPEVQVRRVMRRDGLGESDARARLAAQWPIGDKVRRATDVVDTGGTFEDTDRQIDDICRALDEASRMPAEPSPRG